MVSDSISHHSLPRDGWYFRVSMGFLFVFICMLVPFFILALGSMSGCLVDVCYGLRHNLLLQKCELCPSREGALKPTSQGKWAHVVCALYIKEATFGDTEVMEPILTNQLPKELFQRVGVGLLLYPSFYSLALIPADLLDMSGSSQ